MTTNDRLNSDGGRFACRGRLAVRRSTLSAVFEFSRPLTWSSAESVLTASLSVTRRPAFGWLGDGWGRSPVAHTPRMSPEFSSVRRGPPQNHRSWAERSRDVEVQ